jgi:glutamine synthetase
MSGSRWIDIVWTDLVGRSRVVRATRDACEAGEVRIGADQLSAGFDARATVSAGPQAELKVDWRTERAVPWDEGVSVCCADIWEGDAPSPRCTRSFLRQIADDVGTQGLSLRAAVELEFFLVDPVTGRPLYDQIDNYSLSRVEMESVVSSVRNEMRAMAVAVEASNPEYGGGQVEINIAHADLMAAADQATLARLFIGILAAREGLDATFMSKPWTEESSSGIHVHQSVWRDGRNLFFSPPEELSETGRFYLAGLLESVPQFALLGSPTPNGFHRRADGSFAPTVASWATDNRTTSVRAVLGGEAGTRIEHRDGGSDCNVYLTMGAQVLAGLDGVERGVSPPPAVVGNAYQQDLPKLPRTYVEAFEALRNSELARRLLPAELLDAYLEVLAVEVELTILNAADWERERYGGVPLR